MKEKWLVRTGKKCYWLPLKWIENKHHKIALQWIVKDIVRYESSKLNSFKQASVVQADKYLNLTDPWAKLSDFDGKDEDYNGLNNDITKKYRDGAGP